MYRKREKESSISKSKKIAKENNFEHLNSKLSMNRLCKTVDKGRK